VNPNPIWSLGNSGFAVIEGPGVSNWDSSAAKDVHLRENIALEFRADFYDALNTPHFFLGRGVQTGTPQFGAITTSSDSQRGLSAQPNRTGQLSLRLTF
jgi:hypothetical protein